MAWRCVMTHCAPSGSRQFVNATTPPASRTISWAAATSTARERRSVTMPSSRAAATWHIVTGYYPVRKESYDLAEVVENTKKYPQFTTAIDQLRSSKPTIATAGAVMGPFTQARQYIGNATEETFLYNLVLGVEKVAERRSDTGTDKREGRFSPVEHHTFEFIILQRERDRERRFFAVRYENGFSRVFPLVVRDLNIARLSHRGKVCDFDLLLGADDRKQVFGDDVLYFKLLSRNSGHRYC